MRESTKQNWDTFWQKKSDLKEVYSNSPRIRQNLVPIMDIKDKRILEVGAGTGRDSLFMAEDGANLFLLDYSLNSLILIKEASAGQAPVSILGGNAFSLPFKDRTFDVVFHQGLLEHFKKPEAERLLRENIRVLKTGGLLIVDVPQRWHVYTIVKHILILFNAWFAGWEREFSVRELKNLLASLGLSFRAVYGEWMYPSFFYRTIREIFLRFGVKLPLYPKFSNATAALRKKMRTGLDGNPIKLNTALSIGVIAERKF
jgi:ubiquinone/menaquinone biosynthesis C-methylase UbiE